MTALSTVMGILFFGLAIASVLAIMFQYKYRQYIYGSFGVVVVVLLVVSLFFMPKKEEPVVAESEKARQEALTAEYMRVASQTAPKPESKKEYISSTQRIGRQGSAIYYKEFLKNPNKFMGERVNIRGQIMNIEEADNQTVIQLQITENFDTIIAHYPGSVNVYDGDWVTVYGEGKGTYEGANRMGASMSWPIIAAKYVVKHASGD